jgi:hypothetical protein
MDTIQHHSRFRIFVIALALMASVYLFWWYLNTFVYQSFADQPDVNISFGLKTGEFPVGEEKTITVLIQPQDADANRKKMSAILLSALFAVSPLEQDGP